jgi:hypothetical protein
LLRFLAFYVPPTLVRINATGRFPYVLCLQILELCLDLMEALCHGPEFRGQVNKHDRARGYTYNNNVAFGPVSEPSLDSIDGAYGEP